MEFLALECAAIHTIIQIDENQKPRTYDLGTRRTAESVYDKIMATVVDDRYTDVTIDFTTAEKSFILTCVPTKLSVTEGKIIDTLTTKLS